MKRAILLIAAFAALSTSAAARLVQPPLPAKNMPAVTTFAVGPNAGSASATGTGNTMFGDSAGTSITVPASGANPQGDVLIGYQAGNAMTSGRESVCVGYQACLLLTGDGSGVEDGLNVGLGSFTLSHATTAHANTAVGQKALLDVTTGQYNIGIGPHAGASLSTGQDNIMIGHASGNQAGVDSTGSGNIGIGSLAFAGSGAYSQNVGIGGGALAALTDAADNVAIGGNSGGSVGGSLTTGTRNVFVGTSTGTLAVIANDLTCIGYFACKVATGSSSTYVGSGAGQAVTTGQSNTVVGFSALGADVSGGNNTAIGRQAGKLVTGGSNTIVGTQVGSTTLTTGSGNILIGTSSAVDTPAAGTANYLNIGGLLLGDVGQLHVSFGGAAPTAGTCGTSPGTPSGTDTAGKVTAGTSTASCIVIFNKTYTAAPICQAWDNTARQSLLTVETTSQVTISAASALGGDELRWRCTGL